MALIDDYRRREDLPGQGSVPRPAAPHASQAPTKTIPVTPKKKTFAAPPRRRSKVRTFLQGTAILVFAVALGLGAGSLIVGEVVIGIYAVVALLAHISSRISFGLALFAFVMVMTMQAARPDSGLSSNFAVYAFLLLVVGTLSVYAEIRQESRWDKWRRHSRHKKRI